MALALDIKVGDALNIEGVGKVTVVSKSGKQVRLAIDVDKRYAVALDAHPKTGTGSTYKPAR
jgi:hypothetical protein